MGKFGWSYPAGCDGTPYDDEGPCSVCGKSVDDCICPVCHECGGQGDPTCYDQHNLVRTEAQTKSLAELHATMAKEAEAERAYYEANPHPDETGVAW